MLVSLAAASTAHAQTAYAVNNSGTTLIRFDLSSPGTFTTIGDFTGAATFVDGLDFRASNGLLYGYEQNTNQLFTINTANAATTLVTTLSTASSTFILGLDFNPQVVITPGVLEDRLRLVNPNDQNLRINVATGVTNVDGALTYEAGDSGFGINPEINEAAYTNNDNNINTATQLYYIDSGRNVLATTASPNTGAITTVGTGLGVDTTVNNGFDIFTFGGVNSAFALLSPSGGSTGLYSISLGGGGATFIGALAGDNPVNLAYGLAIAPAVVPETGTVGLLAGAMIVAVPFLRRRK
ncbi:MAG: DUF4394 domain-containing protein [Fibrella sp.]|nr:DUF4394 domain-containing protein [Armatimonadota bacterium]